MNNSHHNHLIQKALMLDTCERTQFLNKIEDQTLKKEIAFLLSDETALTQFSIKTSAGATPLKDFAFKDLKCGDKIKQFIIIKLLAKGGMGSVYLAYDEKLKRNIALKTIRSEFLTSAIAKNRFKQEAEILSKINHPSICQIYDYIEHKESDVLVLEFVKGETLDKAELNNEQVLDVFIQIASALVAAHKKDIIHRDLKPQNIMVTPDGMVKVLDFGIAQSKDQKSTSKNNSKSTALIGTLNYMSPEQVINQSLTKATDIYSFAIIMQQTLSKKPVYDSENSDDLLKQISNAKTVTIANIPTDFRALLAQSTEKEIYKRPTANNMLTQLQAIKQLPFNKTTRRRKIAVMIIFLLFSALVFFQWQNYTNNTQKINFLNDIKDEIKNTADTYQKIYNLPIHNITIEVNALKDQKNQYISTIENSDLLQEAEKKFYIGQIYFTHKNYTQSLEFFESSWNSGHHSPQLASLLSYNHLIIFYQEAKENQYESYYEDSEQNKKLIEKHIIPAQKLMQLSNTDSKSISMNKALLLWHKKEYEKAIEMLSHITKKQNWNFEAYQLQGEILYSMAILEHEKGDLDKKQDLLLRAQTVFDNAKLRGRSFDNLYLQQCTILGNLFEHSLDSEDIDKELTRKHFFDGVENCESALLINPKNPKIYQKLIHLHDSFGFKLIREGKNPMEYLQKAIEYSKQIERIEQKHFIKNVTYTYMGMYKTKNGENPLKDFDKAIDEIYQGLNDQTSVGTNKSYSNIMYIHMSKIHYESNIGVNPDKTIDLLHELYRQAQESKVTSQRYDYLINYIMAEAYKYKAEYLLLINKTPYDAATDAQKYIELSNHFTKDMPYGDGMLASLSISLVKYQLSQGKNPLNHLNKGFEHITLALDKMPNSGDFLTAKAELMMYQQLIKKQNNSDHHIDFKAAIKQYAATLEQLDSASANTQLAELYLHQAQFDLTEKLKKTSIENGIASCINAIKIKPNHALAFFIHAQLLSYGIQAGIYDNDQGNVAEELYKKAQAINPLLTTDSAIARIMTHR